jgi:hypothetical protein
MKLFLSAASAAVLIVTSAFAQPAETPASPSAATSRCPDLAPDPALSDGATASADEVSLAETIYQAWAEASRATIACRRAEYDEMVRVAQSRRDEHNAAAERVNTVTNSWIAEREEYCNRPRTRCSDQNEQ